MHVQSLMLNNQLPRLCSYVLPTYRVSESHKKPLHSHTLQTIMCYQSLIIFYAYLAKVHAHDLALQVVMSCRHSTMASLSQVANTKLNYVIYKQHSLFIKIELTHKYHAQDLCPDSPPQWQ